MTPHEGQICSDAIRDPDPARARTGASRARRRARATRVCARPCAVVPVVPGRHVNHGAPSLLPFLLFPLGLGVNNLPDYRPLGLGVNNLPDYGEQSQLGANRHSGGGVLLVRHEYARRQNAGLPHSIRAARTAAGIPAYGHGIQSTMRWGVGAIRVPAPQERDRRRPSWDLAGTHGSKDVVQRFSTPTRQRPVLRLCGGIRRMRPASGGPAAAGAGHALFGVARASPDGADLEGFVPRAGPGARWKLARFC